MTDTPHRCIVVRHAAAYITRVYEAAYTVAIEEITP